MLSDGLISDFRKINEEDEVIGQLVEIIKGDRDRLARGGCAQAVTLLDQRREEMRSLVQRESRAHSISRGQKRVSLAVISSLSEIGGLLSSGATTGRDDPVSVIRGYMGGRNGKKEELVKNGSARLENAFGFLEKAYGDDNEMLVFVTTLTENKYSSRFIGKYGSDGYFRHNKEVLFYDREKDLQERIGQLEK